MPHARHRLTFILTLLPLLGTNSFAQEAAGKQSADPKSKIPPVVRLGSWHRSGVYNVVRRDSPPWAVSNPLPIKSAEQFAKYFKKDFVAKWRGQVDFDEQELSVWMWRGSGQDELECYVSLSDPAKVLFLVEPGRTKDLQEHLYVFAIRKDVKRRAKPLGLSR